MSSESRLFENQLGKHCAGWTSAGKATYKIKISTLLDQQYEQAAEKDL